MFDIKKVVGGKILIVGDLHFSDVFTGKHKGYLQNCCAILNSILEKVKDVKPSAVVLLGDLVGWSETNIKNREVLSLFCNWFKSINEICKVYCVRGNHDLKGYPDFMFLNKFGLIVTSSDIGGYFDYYGFEGQEVPEVRFHIVDYKDEDKALDLCQGNTSNIVLGHNNYTIAGVTNWYSEHDGIELGMMRNYSGVDMVISGHIHNPSLEIHSTQMPDGSSCMLFYPGCPTRPIRDKNMYEACWYVLISYNSDTESTDIDTDIFKLEPSRDIFVDDDLFINEKTQEELDEEMRREALKDILTDLTKYRMLQCDPISQVMNIPNASDEAKKVACDYLQLVFNQGA